MKLLKTVIAFAILAVTCHAYKDYSGYKTFRIWPQNEEQFFLLRLLHSDPAYDFWTESRTVGKPADVMVEPEKLDFFQRLLSVNNFNAKILINNVSSVIRSPEELEMRRIKTAHGNSRISFEHYERYETMQEYMRELANTYSDVTLLNIGKTYEGRDMLGLKISSGGSNKPAIFVDGGIHAREWIAPCTALYIIQELIQNPNNKEMYSAVDWYIFPEINPDGYEYTHTSDRMWRKTRSPGRYCKGADPNRNFDFHWNEIGTSNDECSDIYAGSHAFSEIEAVNIKNFATKISTSVKLYLSFHSYGNYLLYSWGYSSILPTNWKELDDLAQDVNKAIMAAGGESYTIGTAANALYPAAGGSDDWMKGVLGVPLSYTIELPAGGWSGFDPEPEEIRGIIQETFVGVKVYAQYVAKKYALN